VSCNLNIVLLLAADEGDDLSTCGVAENIFKISPGWSKKGFVHIRGYVK